MSASVLKSSASEAEVASVRDPQLVKIVRLSEELVGSMKTFFGSLDRSLYGELRIIADFIAKARDEISALRPNDLRREGLPSAGAELDAIVKDTETATNQIMTAAEAMLACDAADLAAYKAFVEQQAMAIFEACSFQDITGQRVTKVVTVLRQIEDRVGKLADNLGIADAEGAASDETPEEKRKREQILNGPAIGGPETKQDDIDAMFAEGGSASQDDIDALFA
jgi:chemotaxis protein CheZ